jgi:hypothetical protein
MHYQNVRSCISVINLGFLKSISIRQAVNFSRTALSHFTPESFTPHPCLPADPELRIVQGLRDSSLPMKPCLVSVEFLQLMVM